MPQICELKVFLIAAEELSFSRAAERLHLSQSAVSQNIQSLEREYGVDLFERRGRSMRLTVGGQALLPMAQETVSALQRMSEAMSGLEGKVAGDLMIGCSTTSGKYLLPNLVASFRRDYPQVRVSIKILARDEVITRLLDERLALGVTGRKLSKAVLTEGVYAGASLEAGRIGGPLVPGSPNDLQTSGSVFLAADTPLGPMYLGYGMGEDDNRTLYFFLGRP